MDKQFKSLNRRIKFLEVTPFLNPGISLPKFKDIILPKLINFLLGILCLYYVGYLINILAEFAKATILLLILSIFQTQINLHLEKTGSSLMIVLNSLFSIVKTFIDISIELIETSLKEPKNEK